MVYRIISLTPNLLRDHQKVLLVMDQQIIAERWGVFNFIVDLPGKWECSRIVLFNERPVGYMIATFKEASVHINRIVVDPSYQRSGIGIRLLMDAAQSAFRYQKPLVTLKVFRKNENAIGFYKRRGFCLKTKDEKNLSLYIEAGFILSSIGETT